MKKQCRSIEQPICIEPQLQQWGYLFNPPSAIGWQTGQRALDIYKCAAPVRWSLVVCNRVKSYRKCRSQPVGWLHIRRSACNFMSQISFDMHTASLIQQRVICVMSLYHPDQALPLVQALIADGLSRDG